MNISSQKDGDKTTYTSSKRGVVYEAYREEKEEEKVIIRTMFVADEDTSKFGSMKKVILSTGKTHNITGDKSLFIGIPTKVNKRFYSAFGSQSQGGLTLNGNIKIGNAHNQEIIAENTYYLQGFKDTFINPILMPNIMAITGKNGNRVFWIPKGESFEAGYINRRFYANFYNLQTNETS